MKTRSMAVVALLALTAVVAYGVWSFTTQSTDAKDIAAYGNVEDQTERTVPIAELLSGDHTGPASVEGTVVDMGPAMGCWLVVDDGTGQLLVQTDPMIYVDQSVHGKTIRASGKLTVLDGGMGFTGETPALLTPGVTVTGGDNGS